jgi:hypothetical protein
MGSAYTSVSNKLQTTIHLPLISVPILFRFVLVNSIERQRAGMPLVVL